MRIEIENLYAAIEKKYDSTIATISEKYLKQYSTALANVKDRNEIMGLFTHYFSDSCYKDMRLSAIKGFLQELDKVMEIPNLKVWVNNMEPEIVVTVDGQNQMNFSRSNRINIDENYKLVDLTSSVSMKRFEMHLNKFLLHFPFNYSAFSPADAELKYRFVAGEKRNIINSKIDLYDNYPKAFLDIFELDNSDNGNIFQAAYMLMKKIDKTRTYPNLNINNNDEYLLKSFKYSNDKDLYIKRLFTGAECFYEKNCTNKFDDCLYGQALHHSFFAEIFDYLKSNSDVINEEILLNIIKLNNDMFTEFQVTGGIGENYNVSIYQKPEREDWESNKKVNHEEFFKFCEKIIISMIEKNSHSEIIDKLYDKDLTVVRMDDMNIVNVYEIFRNSVEKYKIKNGLRNEINYSDAKLTTSGNHIEIMFPKDLAVSINVPNSAYINQTMMMMASENIDFNVSDDNRLYAKVTFDKPCILTKEDLLKYFINFFEDTLSRINECSNGICANNFRVSKYSKLEENTIALTNFAKELNLLNKIEQKDSHSPITVRNKI